MRYRWLLLMVGLLGAAPVASAQTGTNFSFVQNWCGDSISCGGSPAPTYPDGALVKFNGSVFVCAAPSSNCGFGNANAPDVNHQWNALAGVHAWDSSVTYQPNTMVVRNGNIFSAIVENINQDPAGGLNINWRARGSNPSNLASLPPGATGFNLAWSTTPGFTVTEAGSLPMKIQLDGVGGYFPYQVFNLAGSSIFKSAIVCQSISSSGTTNDCIVVGHFSQKDTGGDVSGISASEWGNGNAISAIKFTGATVPPLPPGLPALTHAPSRSWGFNIEATSFGPIGTNIISGFLGGVPPASPNAGKGIAYAAGVGNGIGPPWSEGLRIYPVEDNGVIPGTNLGSRIAIAVCTLSFCVDSVSLTDLSFLLKMDGTLTIPSLKSNSGTRFLCVNTSGTIVSQTTACSGT